MKPLLLICMFLCACDNKPFVRLCEDGTPHTYTRWSESKLVSEHGRDLVLGIPLNLTETQFRTCEKCGLQETRYFKGNDQP